MTNLCIQVENYVSPFAKQLPKIQTQDLIYIERFEDDSYGHWMFGSDANSLIDKVNSRSLSVQAGAAIQPVYGDGFVQLSTQGGNALVTQLLDSDITEFTISALVFPESTSLSILLGVLGSSSSGDGFGIFSSAGKLYATIRPQVSSWDMGLTLNPEKAVFVSLSINKTTGYAIFCAKQDSIFYSKETANLQYVNSNLPLSIGNYRYPASQASKARHFEAIIHTKALEQSEIQALANRMQSRQAYHGHNF